MITLEPRPTFENFSCKKKYTKSYRVDEPNHLIYLSSGKAAISIILDYFLATNKILDKNASLFVPYWIGSPVYQEIAGKVIPSPGNKNSCDIYLMYHQYGYPQDVNGFRNFINTENPIIIEDLAHRIEGPVRFVENSIDELYAINSFSKFIYCNMLGGITTTDSNLMEWIKQIPRKKSYLMNLFKLIDELNIRRRNFPQEDRLKNIRKMYFSLFASYPFPLDCSVNIFNHGIEQEVAAREKNYKLIKEKLIGFDIFPDAKFDCKAPYAVPLRCNKNKIEIIQKKLTELGIRAGNYNFDFNHNNLNPNFQKALVIPCHSQLGQRQIGQMCNVIKDQL